jgi:hypothetical protein
MSPCVPIPPLDLPSPPFRQRYLADPVASLKSLNSRCVNVIVSGGGLTSAFHLSLERQKAYDDLEECGTACGAGALQRPDLACRWRRLEA